MNLLFNYVDFYYIFSDLYLVQLSKETSQNVPNCYVYLIVVFFLFQIKNISKLAEVSRNNALQLSEKLRNMKNQSESEEEKMNLLIKKLKMFLLGNFFLNIRTSFRPSPTLPPLLSPHPPPPPSFSSFFNVYSNVTTNSKLH